MGKAVIIGVPTAILAALQINEQLKPKPEAPAIQAPAVAPAAVKPKKPATTATISKKPVREPTWFEKIFEPQQGAWPQRDPSTRD